MRVGYVMGSGDRVADAIARMGLAVTRLDEDTLFSGDLGRFDVIVAGILAAKVRPDFVSSHGRLLDWVRGGGRSSCSTSGRTTRSEGCLPTPRG